MEHLTQGNSLFVQGRYEEAIQHYTQAISKLTDERQFEAHFGRAVARIELKDPNCLCVFFLFLILQPSNTHGKKQKKNKKNQHFWEKHHQLYVI